MLVSTLNNNNLDYQYFITKYGNLPNDIIQLQILNTVGTILDTVYADSSYYNLSDHKFGITSNINTVNVDIERVFVTNGYLNGKFNFNLRFLRNLVGNESNTLTIRDISKSRTEIRLVYSGQDSNIIDSFINFGQYPLYDDYGNAILYSLISNNSDYQIINFVLDSDTVTVSPYSLVLKLATPLDKTIAVGDSFWISETIADTVNDSIIISNAIAETNNYNKIAGPNFNINIDERLQYSSGYRSWNDILNTSTSGSQQLINTYVSSSFGDVTLNIDYSDYNNFIFYGSAASRLNNFKYKLSLIEQYNSRNVLLTGLTGSTVSAIQNITDNTGKIQAVVAGFDGYENYLYYNGGPYTWPKSTGYPYQLVSVSSSIGIAWFNGQLNAASIYDTGNINRLQYQLPNFIQADTNNIRFLLFVDMLGHYFDLIWVYIQHLSKVSDRNEDIDIGLSKDLIFDLAKSLGLDVDNSKMVEDLWLYSLDRVNTVSGNTINSGDYMKQIWKRIINNLPYILKTKGTETGIRALINCYGVPSTILRIKEYGGPELSTTVSKRKSNKHAYQLQLVNGSIISSSYSTINTVKIGNTGSAGWQQMQNEGGSFPWAIEMRFKPDITNITKKQSLFQIGLNDISDDPTAVVINMNISLNYLNGQVGYIGLELNNSGSTLVNSANKITKLNDFDISKAYTASISTGSTSSTSYGILPLFNGGYWYLLINRYNTGSALYVDTGSTPMNYLISVAQCDDSNNITFQDHTLLCCSTNTPVITKSTASIGGFTLTGQAYISASNLFGTNFNGYVQEFRYWSRRLDVNNWLNNRITAPYTYFGDTYSSSYNDLGLKLAYSVSQSGNVIPSSHPNLVYNVFNDNVTPLVGSYVSYDTTISSVNPVVYTALTLDSSQQVVQSSFSETQYLSWPSLGMNRELSNKIRIDTIVTSSTALSVNTSIVNSSLAVFPVDSPKLGIYFSPTNVINEDIANELGPLLLDNLIGDSEADSAETYPNIVTYLNEYLLKFRNNKYSYMSYINYIASYDASLFYMIKKMLPARTVKMVGLVYEAPLLNRSKVKSTYTVNTANNSNTSSVEIYGNIKLTGSYSYVTASIVSTIKITGSTTKNPTGSASLLPALTSSNYAQNSGKFISSPVLRSLLSDLSYIGTRISSSGINIPSSQLPGSIPVIQQFITNPNNIVLTDSPSSGNTGP